MTYEETEILGLTALAHMAAHEEIITAYLRLTGMTPDRLKDSATDPATLGSILDYFLQNEKRLLSFCQAEDIAPEQIVAARRLLPGGEITADNI